MTELFSIPSADGTGVQPKLHTSVSSVITYNGLTDYTPADVDKLEIRELKEFKKVIADCRIFYERDPIASTVINKIVEIGINDLIIDQGTLSDNEYRVFEGVKPKLLKFMQDCAKEYLISGLVVPEIDFNSISNYDLKKMGVKKYESLQLPENMWLRDPTTIEIKSMMFANKPSYFIIVSEEVAYFIKNHGKYMDGLEDPELYQWLVENYPEFVAQVEKGATKVLYTNDLIVRRNVITKSPFPIPYLYPALEALKHKRNLRRMDYAIAARVQRAILHVKVGTDEFPALEEDENDSFETLRQQMLWRNSGGRDIEAVFELITNHTVEMNWVVPPVEALLDEAKYAEVNQDIFFGLGFPRILTTGENQRSQSSNAGIAVLSPVEMINYIRNDLIAIAESIIFDISEKNKFKDTPNVRFEKVDLLSAEQKLAVLQALYTSGNISRKTYAKEFGYNFDEEVKQREDEEKKLMDTGVPVFAPAPFSPQPGNPNQPQNKTDKPQDKEPASKEAPAKKTEKKPKAE